MKKIISAFLLVICLCGCTAKSYTPVITTDFALNAVYKTGDFSYSCVIERKNGTVSVIPTSTRANGMIITYDGRNVTFDRNSMMYTFEKDKIDFTNPAIVLYEVFASLENIDLSEINVVDDEFRYTGKTSVGNYVFVQDIDNSYKSISIPDADIKVTFS